MVSFREDAPFKVVFQSKVLGHKQRLPIFLDHLEVIRWVHLALEEDAEARLISDLLGAKGGWTHVLTAYLKNSVTSAVEPLSVIDCF